MASQWSKWYTGCFTSVYFYRHKLHLNKAKRKQNGVFVLKISMKRKNISWDEFTEIARENTLRMDNLESLQGYGSKWLKYLLPIPRGRQCEEIQYSCEKPSALSRKDTHPSGFRATFSAVLLGGATVAHLLLRNRPIIPHDLNGSGIYSNWNWELWIINSFRICSIY